MESQQLGLMCWIAGEVVHFILIAIRVAAVQIRHYLRAVGGEVLGFQRIGGGLKQFPASAIDFSRRPFNGADRAVVHVLAMDGVGISPPKQPGSL